MPATSAGMTLSGKTQNRKIHTFLIFALKIRPGRDVHHIAIVIVVDDDVDVFDTNDVKWRWRRASDRYGHFLCSRRQGAILDPTSDPENFHGDKDGDRPRGPRGRDYAERLAISDDKRARARALLGTAGVKI